MWGVGTLHDDQQTLRIRNNPEMVQAFERQFASLQRQPHACLSALELPAH
jgi:hypothetical protein